jgi:maleate isomerase
MIKLEKINPKFSSFSNPKIGLITLASDFRIEKDFNMIINGNSIDLYCNRIKSYNPLTNESLKKMAENITNVTEEILPGEKIDCIAYGCTSGTIATGYKNIYEKVNKAKPNTKVTTPITSAIKALESLKIKKITIFTPYTDEINQSLIKYFNDNNFNIIKLTYLDIKSDIDIGKVDIDHLYDVLSNLDLSDSDALFVSCTALPVLSLIDRLEEKLKKPVLSSNQTLIWDTLKEINYNKKIEGFGVLFNN